MRQITQDSVSAFMNHMNFSRSNTDVLPDSANRHTMFLFDNAIARFNHNGELEICDGGYQSATTKERLNGLPNVTVYQRQGQWFLNDKPWDGEWTVV